MPKNDLSESRIWVQPACEDECERGWASYDWGPCEDCGLPCVAYVRADEAERQLAEALGQIGAEHAAHLATGKWLADTEHLLRTILDAEQHFRNALPEEWGGDPIHDACEAARAALPDEPLWTTRSQP